MKTPHLILLFLFLLGSSLVAADKPNIIMILADNVRQCARLIVP